jgi:undecaprenyl-diphosphatase
VTWLQGVVLGIVQGATEFLPVSSSGHLVVTQALLGIDPPGVVLEVLVHVATLFAVVVVYWRRIGDLTAKCFRGDRESWRFVLLLGLATIPGAVVGVLLNDVVERAFSSLVVVGIGFIVTGTVLWSTRRVADAGTREVRPMTALLVGLAQAVAILPGVSRSGSTISAALWLGLEPVAAAEFSFLMAVVIIAGSGAWEARHIPPGVDIWSLPFAAAFIAALVVGVFAIQVLVIMLRRRAFHVFAPYCWLLGALTLLGALWRA